jgi:hypothetical protein
MFVGLCGRLAPGGPGRHPRSPHEEVHACVPVIDVALIHRDVELTCRHISGQLLCRTIIEMSPEEETAAARMGQDLG